MIKERIIIQPDKKENIFIINTNRLFLRAIYVNTRVHPAEIPMAVKKKSLKQISIVKPEWDNGIKAELSLLKKNTITKNPWNEHVTVFLFLANEKIMDNRKMLSYVSSRKKVENFIVYPIPTSKQLFQAFEKKVDKPELCAGLVIDDFLQLFHP